MSTHRIIDANANRAREALRVMEDVARFVLDDASVTESLKRVRHELAEALDALPGGESLRLAHRDTQGDVGTIIETKAEYQRAGVREVASAAANRLGEALRSIEEVAKTLERGGIDLARAVERLRYRGYDIERDLVLALGGSRAKQWSLCVLVTESLCAHHDWIDVAQNAVRGGADCIQLREPELGDRELLDRARVLVNEMKSFDEHVSIIINDRPDIALLAGADGVHVGQDDLPVREIRRIAGDALFVGVSTGCIAQAEQARRNGADYCGVGPMFASTTKNKDHLAGPAYLREYVSRTAPLPPHLAIGGITPRNIDVVVAAGAKGVAASSCVCAAERPQHVCEQLVEVLTRANTVSG